MNTRYELFKMDIIQGRIPGKLDSFFYDTGDVTSVVATDGTEFRLICEGEVEITLHPDSPKKRCDYKNDQRFEAIEKHKLTDRKLQGLNKRNEIYWSMNNWFEVIWKVPGGDWDCDLGTVEHDYDSAIQMLKNNVNEQNRTKVSA